MWPVTSSQESYKTGYREQSWGLASLPHRIRESGSAPLHQPIKYGKWGWKWLLEIDILYRNWRNKWDDWANSWWSHDLFLSWNNRRDIFMHLNWSPHQVHPLCSAVTKVVHTSHALIEEIHVTLVPPLSHSPKLWSDNQNRISNINIKYHQMQSTSEKDKFNFTNHRIQHILTTIKGNTRTAHQTQHLSIIYNNFLN